MKRRSILVITALSVTTVLTFGLNLTARGAYESAPYKVVRKDSEYEIREYPDLVLAETDTRVASNGRDGSFMKLFRYISGANETNQKIAMTTPVFMEGGANNKTASMGFVMPKSIAASGAPEPTGSGVVLATRRGGRFAVIRFSGRMNSNLTQKNEQKLRNWMKKNGIEGAETADTAGYDAPFTPGPFRRNEVLIRIVEDAKAEDAQAGGSSQSVD